MTSSESLLEILEARELTYRILSTSFIKEPNADLLELTLQDRLFESFPLEINTIEFQQGLDQLKQWCKKVEDDSLQDILEQLKADYSRLFVGPDNLLAPPWESVYLTEERLTFDRITLDVREFYRRHGLEFVLLNKEPDDHFGVELEFMAELINHQIQRLEKDHAEEAFYLTKEQEIFLRDHLIQWTPHFSLSVLNGAHTDYYLGLARLAQAFIIWDYEYLSAK